MNKALKKMKRKELLEILIAQQKEIESLQAQLKNAKQELDTRKITIEQSGSIAQASLALNQVFESAQKSADQYLLNIQMKESELAKMKIETQNWCDEMKRATRVECEKMIRASMQRK